MMLSVGKHESAVRFAGTHGPGLWLSGGLLRSGRGATLTPLPSTWKHAGIGQPTGNLNSTREDNDSGSTRRYSPE